MLDDKKWVLPNWAELKSQYDPDLPMDMRKMCEESVKLFDSGVDMLRTPEHFPNKNINKLMILFWRLVGNKITPAAIAPPVKTLSFWAEVKGLESIAVVMVPSNWVKMCHDEKWMQLGGLCYVASQAADYWHAKIFNREDTIKRAQAYEAEFLNQLKTMVKFDLNEYQQEVLNKFPNGLESCSLVYPLQEFKT